MIFAITAILAASLFQNSRYGLMLRASRDDEVAGKAVAVNIVKVRLIAFVPSAFIVGIGGGLYAHLLGVLMVDAFFLPLTSSRSRCWWWAVSGAVLGVVVVTLVTEGLRIFEGGLHIGSKVVSLPHGTQEIGLGVFMAVILVCRPNGLVGRSEIDWRCVWPRRRGGQEFASKPSALVPHQ